MYFKIGKTKIHITFFFAAGLSLFAVRQGGAALFAVLSAVLLHECTHVICLCVFRSAPTQITVGLFGMRMSDESLRLLPYKKEIISTLSAPLVNLCVFFCLLPFAQRNETVLTACAAHFSFGFFNLLPMRCLDGGRSLFCFLRLHLSELKAEKRMRIIEWICFFFFFVLLCIYFFTVHIEPTAVIFLFYLAFLLFFRK